MNQYLDKEFCQPENKNESRVVSIICNMLENIKMNKMLVLEKKLHYDSITLVIFSFQFIQL